MKKFLLAISFVFAFTVVTNAQTERAAPDKKASEQAQPGDDNYKAPASSSATSEIKDAKAESKKTEKSCSKAKECKKGKSCCKKGGAKAKTEAKAEKACCKKSAKACGHHKAETKKEQGEAEAAEAAAEEVKQ